MPKFVSSTELILALRPLGFRDVETLDSRYFCPERGWLDDFASWLGRRRRRYMIEKYDCDNFTRWAAAGADEALYENDAVSDCGHTFGEASCMLKTTDAGGMPRFQAHALNLCLCDDGKFYVFEPQNGDITPLEKFTGTWTRIRV